MRAISVLVFAATAALAAPSAHKFDKLLASLSTYDTISVDWDGVSLLEDGIAQPRAYVHVRALGRDWELQLTRHDELYAPSYNTFSAVDGQIVQDETVHRRCQYRGVVKGDDTSKVALSLCDGMKGLVSSGAESFFIEPVPESHDLLLSKGADHIAYRLSDLRMQSASGKTYQCGVGIIGPKGKRLLDENHRHDMDASEVVGRFISAQAQPVGAFESLQEQVQQAKAEAVSSESVSGSNKLLAGARRRYVELLVVSDQTYCQSFPGATSAIKRAAAYENAATIVNIVAALYLNGPFDDDIRVILSAQTSLCDGNTFAAPTAAGGAGEVSVDSLLGNFHSWRVANKADLPAHDNAHLFSGFDFEDGVVGYAGVSAMCFPASSGGINQMTFSDAYNAAVVTHEMGHNFGMRHDSSGNDCPSSGFIMAAVGGPHDVPEDFSSCSKSYMETFLAEASSTVACLDNEPQITWGDPVCGNGIVEPGEACDCGGKDCSALGDPCCDGRVCRLQTGSTCSLADTCCELSSGSCRFKAANTVCRALAPGSCDLAEERCTGSSPRCPIQTYKASGSSCGTDGACYGKLCVSHAQECLVVGQGYTGSPYQACTNTASDSNKASCGNMLCSRVGASPTSCYTFNQQTSGGAQTSVRFPDGIACAAGKQCVGNSCVSSAGLDEYQWTTSDWSNCTKSCIGRSEDPPVAGTQTRTVSCVTLQGTPAADSLCPDDSRPSNQTKCNNYVCDACLDITCANEGVCDSPTERCVCKNFFGGTTCEHSSSVALVSAMPATLSASSDLASSAASFDFNVTGGIEWLAILLKPVATEFWSQYIIRPGGQHKHGFPVGNNNGAGATTQFNWSPPPTIKAGDYRMRVRWNTGSFDSDVFTLTCSDAECGNGKCVDGLCKCDDGWEYGTVNATAGVCQVYTPCKSSRGCSGRGHCDASTSGDCVCAEPLKWKGQYCDVPADATPACPVDTCKFNSIMIENGNDTCKAEVNGTTATSLCDCSAGDNWRSGATCAHCRLKDTSDTVKDGLCVHGKLSSDDITADNCVACTCTVNSRLAAFSGGRLGNELSPFVGTLCQYLWRSVTLLISLDFTNFNTDLLYDQFKALFEHDMAFALGIPLDQVTVFLVEKEERSNLDKIKAKGNALLGREAEDEKELGTIVKFELRSSQEDENEAEIELKQRESDLLTQFADSNSFFWRGEASRHSDPDFTPVTCDPKVEDCSEGLTAVEVGIIVVGSILFLGTCIYCYRKHKKKKAAKNKQQTEMQPRGGGATYHSQAQRPVR